MCYNQIIGGNKVTEEQIKKALDYIRTHVPQKTEFETIDVAIRAVTRGISAARAEDLVNRDDAWLIPPEERGKFEGIRGVGGAQGFVQETIRRFKEAVQYAMEHASELKTSSEEPIVFDNKKDDLDKFLKYYNVNVQSDDSYDDSYDDGGYNRKF